MRNEFFELERLQKLMEGRREEYRIFGCTEEDRRQDRNTLKRIEELKSLLQDKLE